MAIGYNDISDILSAGNNAYSNLWQAEIILPEHVLAIMNGKNPFQPEGSDNTKTVAFYDDKKVFNLSKEEYQKAIKFFNVRLDGFSPPSVSLKTSTVKFFGGRDMIIPIQAFTLSNSFTLTLKLDDQYQLLKALKYWRNSFLYLRDVLSPIYVNQLYGEINIYLERPKDYRSDINPKDYDIKRFRTFTKDNNTIQKVYSYKKIICTNVSEPELKQGTSDNLNTKATFLFFDFEEFG